jgi:deoxyhypusine monooxygenase
MIVIFYQLIQLLRVKKKNIPELKAHLNNHDLPIFDRYRSLFKLRNIATEEAVLAICSSLYDDSNGPLFLHEVAYVLGQLRHPASLEALT